MKGASAARAVHCHYPGRGTRPCQEVLAPGERYRRRRRAVTRWAGAPALRARGAPGCGVHRSAVRGPAPPQPGGLAPRVTTGPTCRRAMAPPSRRGFLFGEFWPHRTWARAQMTLPRSLPSLPPARSRSTWSARRNIKALVLRLARENTEWGYRRICPRRAGRARSRGRCVDGMGDPQGQRRRSRSSTTDPGRRRRSG